MSGVAGIWNFDGRPVDRSALARCGAAFSQTPGDSTFMWCHAGMAVTCRTPQAAEGDLRTPDRGSRLAVAFIGRLDNRAKLLTALRSTADISETSSDACLVLAAFTLFDDRCPEHLAGDFALAILDPARRRLLLVRDRLGVQPLYIWRSSTTLVFGTTIATLLSHPDVPARPDVATVARSVMGRLTPHDRSATCFHGVAALPAAHVAVVTADKTATRQYWQLDPSRQIRMPRFDDYADGFRHYFDMAVKRRLGGGPPVAVSLSGGLDSSAVYCHAQTLRRAVNGVSYPAVIGISYVHADHSPADERQYLSDIEAMYGRIDTLPAVSDENILVGAFEQLSASEVPILSLQWQNYSRLLDRARERGARVLLTGQAADQVMLDEAYLVDLFRRLRWLRLWADLREIPRWLTDAEAGIFTRDFVSNLVRFYCPDAAMPMARRVGAAWSGADQERPWYTATFLDHAPVPRSSTAGWGSSSYSASLHSYLTSASLATSTEWYTKVAASRGLELRAPFLDPDLIAFLLAVPGDVQTWKGVPKALLREAMRAALPPSIAHRRSKGDYTTQTNDSLRRIVPDILRSLRSGGLVAEFGFVDRAIMLRELERLEPHVRGPLFGAGFRIWRLVGLEYWLQLFFGAGARSLPAACGI